MILFLFCLLISCSENHKQDISKDLIQNKLKSKGATVFGKLKFGMNLNEVRNTLDKMSQEDDRVIKEGARYIYTYTNPALGTMSMKIYFEVGSNGLSLVRLLSPLILSEQEQISAGLFYEFVELYRLKYGKGDWEGESDYQACKVGRKNSFELIKVIDDLKIDILYAYVGFAPPTLAITYTNLILSENELSKTLDDI